MPFWKRNMYVLWFGCFFSSMCYTLVTPFMPLFLKELNVGRGIETWAGVILSSSFLTSAIMSPIWGALADRYGRKVMVIRSGIGMGICYSLQFFVANHYQLLLIRTLNGFFSGFVPAATALIATNTPEDEIGPSLGILQTASASGSIMGPMFGGLMAQYLGYRMTFMTAGLILLMGTALVWLGVKETTPKKTDSKVRVLDDLRTALSNSSLRTVLVTAALVNASMNILQPVLSLQITKLGQAGTATIVAGFVYSLAGVASVIGAPIWASKGRKTGYKVIMVTGLLGAGLLNIPLAFVTSLVMFGAIRFCVGLATSGVNLSVNATTSRSVSADFRGRAFGILQSFHQAGAVLGPTAGGVTGTMYGLEATFLLAAVIFLATGFAAWRFLPSDRTAPAAQSASA